MKLKNIIIIAVILALASHAAGCGGSNWQAGSTETSVGGENEAVYRKLTPAEAKNMMDSGAQYILLDVRTEEEYKQGRIDGAMPIPYDQIETRAVAELPDKGALILVYCRSGSRSSTAAHTLVSMGYTNMYDLGGIMNWPYSTTAG